VTGVAFASTECHREKPLSRHQNRVYHFSPLCNLTPSMRCGDSGYGHEKGPPPVWREGSRLVLYR